MCEAQVSVEHVEDVIHMVADTVGVTIEERFDTRSVRRAVLESGIASRVQGAEYVVNCDGVSAVLYPFVGKLLT